MEYGNLTPSHRQRGKIGMTRVLLSGFVVVGEKKVTDLSRQEYQGSYLYVHIWQLGSLGSVGSALRDMPGSVAF